MLFLKLLDIYIDTIWIPAGPTWGLDPKVEKHRYSVNKIGQKLPRHLTNVSNLKIWHVDFLYPL